MDPHSEQHKERRDLPELGGAVEKAAVRPAERRKAVIAAVENCMVIYTKMETEQSRQLPNRSMFFADCDVMGSPVLVLSHNDALHSTRSFVESYARIVRAVCHEPVERQNESINTQHAENAERR